jgi:hypothetical protein
MTECPDWCAREPRIHEDAEPYLSYHRSPVSVAGSAYVYLMDTGLEAEPDHRMTVGSFDGPPDDPNPSVFLKLDEARRLAGFLTAIGHEDIAAAIRALHVQAQPRPEAGLEAGS